MTCCASPRRTVWQPSRTCSCFVSDALVPGGKGEKTAEFVLLKVLYETFPAAVLALVEKLPAYGSWNDPLALLLECYHGGHGDHSALFCSLL